MEWEAWAERVPNVDGYKRELIRMNLHEFELLCQCNPDFSGIPVVYVVDGPWLRCWPIPQQGWHAVAFRTADTCSFMLTREAPVKFVEGGPW